MRSRIWRGPVGLAATMLLGIAVCGPAAAQLAIDSVLATLNRLSIELPTNLFVNEPVRSPLAALSREPCDQKAIEELGTALEKVGRRREAATAHISFSATCPGHHAPSLRTAVNILLTLSDYTTAAAVASHLIALEPFNDNGYFLRAVANDRGGLFKQAIDDYVTAIELFGDKSHISSVAYLGMARGYEKLGQFCDAVLPIETWVSLNPAQNDTSQTRATIADYTAKGRCQPGAAGGEEVFRLGRQTTSSSCRSASTACSATSSSTPAPPSYRSPTHSRKRPRSRSIKTAHCTFTPPTGLARASRAGQLPSSCARWPPRTCRSWFNRMPRPPTGTASTGSWA